MSDAEQRQLAIDVENVDRLIAAVKSPALNRQERVTIENAWQRIVQAATANNSKRDDRTVAESAAD
jgi:hypothetical protein